MRFWTDPRNSADRPRNKPTNEVDRITPYQKTNLERKFASSTGDFCILRAPPVWFLCTWGFPEPRSHWCVSPPTSSRGNSDRRDVGLSSPLLQLTGYFPPQSFKKMGDLNPLLVILLCPLQKSVSFSSRLGETMKGQSIFYWLTPLNLSWDVISTPQSLRLQGCISCQQVEVAKPADMKEDNWGKTKEKLLLILTWQFIPIVHSFLQLSLLNSYWMLAELGFYFSLNCLSMNPAETVLGRSNKCESFFLYQFWVTYSFRRGRIKISRHSWREHR